MKATLTSFILWMLTSSDLMVAEYQQGQMKTQYFIEVPQNQTVNEGDTILLRCRVGNRQGIVQWTRNGFAMGYSNTEIQRTCKSCQLNVIENDGVYNLLVANVRLGHDEYFECQVSPGKGAANSVPLRAPVHITIQVPPKSVTLGRPEPVRAGESMQLACTAKDSNPKTSLTWFRDDNPLPDGAVSEVSEKVYKGSRNGTFMTVSKITLMTSASDDGATIKCRASHPTLVPGAIYPHLEDTTNITIHYPPSPPQILGDLRPEQRSGDKVKLTCITEGGNPLPKLSWLRNGLPLQERNMLLESAPPGTLEMTAGAEQLETAEGGSLSSASSLLANQVTEKIESLGQSRSELTLYLSPTDHGATYRCRSFAANTMTRPIDSDERVTFNITFPAESVVLSGAAEVKIDQSYLYRCEANNANPPPKIQWIVNGLVTTAGVSTQTHPPPPQPSGFVPHHHPTGWRVTSDLSLNIVEEDTAIIITCNAISQGHYGDSMIKKDELVLTVLKPPSPPEITGLPTNQTLREGQALSLTCASTDGSPRPHLAWYVGDSSVELSHSNLTLSPYSQSQLRLVASRQDNNRDYRCEAINKANEADPAVTHIHYRVFFPPQSLSIVVDRPDKGSGYDRTIDFEDIASNSRMHQDLIRMAVEGELVRLRCQAGESSPRPVFRWLENGKPRDANRTEVAVGAFVGGEKVTSIVEFRAKPEHNGNIYQCFAHNPTFFDEATMQPELNATIKLQVLYKPRFDKASLKSYAVLEGQSVNVTLNATGNPPQIEYKWQLPSQAMNVRLEGPQLTIGKAQRSHRGNYTIQAWNGHGNFNTTVTIFVDVQYAPRIKFISANVTADEGDIAEFRCQVDANPLGEDSIHWYLPDHPNDAEPGHDWRDRSQITFLPSEMTSVLRLTGIERSDTGRVVCTASNGVQDVIKSSASYLTVNHAPHIDRRPELTKMAFARGAPANLICRASGHPEVVFTWFLQRASDGDGAASGGEDNDRMEKVGMRHRDRGEYVREAEKINVPEYLSTTYESVLEIDNIRTEHYNTKFRCEAANKYGAASHDIEIVKPGPPETPKSVEVTAIDDTSISLAWWPGFNGGYNQSFDIQVFDEDLGHRVLKLKNIRRVEGNRTIIQGLAPQTRYALKIRAWNREGYSNFSEETIVKTRPMERAATPGNLVETQWVVAAIASGLVGVIVVAMIIYLCCFNSRSRSKVLSQNSNSAPGAINSTSMDQQTPRRRETVESPAKQVVIEKYHPVDYFYPPPSYDQSGTSSSNSHYREMTGRTFSLPRRHEFECEDKSRHRSGSSRHMRHASGTFSLHGTLRRNHSSSGHFNSTLEDDVFDDSISAPNSAKPLLHESSAAGGKPQYFAHLYNLSPYDPLDSSSSSRSRNNGYPMRNTLAHSKSVYHVSSAPPLPPSGNGTIQRLKNHGHGNRRQFRSNSSGCFLDSLELETPTPPPPPLVSTPGPLLGSKSAAAFFADKPKYKFNGYLPKLPSAATDYTSAGSPPITPVPTPPPPPPMISSKTLKSFEFNRKSPAHIL